MPGQKEDRMPFQSNFELHLQDSLRRATSWQWSATWPGSQDCRGKGWCCLPVPHGWPHDHGLCRLVQSLTRLVRFPCPPWVNWEGKASSGTGQQREEDSGRRCSVEVGEDFAMWLAGPVFLPPFLVCFFVLPPLVTLRPVTGTCHASPLSRLQCSSVPFYRLT